MASPIRVCLLLSHFHPIASGAERQALAQGTELARRGHSVRVVTRAVAGRPRDESIGGVSVHRWIETSTAGPMFGLSFVYHAVRSLRALRPHYDLIHTHQGLWEAISTGVGRSFLRGAPVLVQPASSGYYGEASELRRTKGFPVLRRLVLRNRRFAAISADIEAQWLGLGVRPDRIVRMASGVDAEAYRPGPSSALDDLPAGPRVVFTGRLHPQKNLDVLLDAWPSVVEASGARLVLVGDGPDRARLADRAVALGISDHVDFRGSTPDPAETLRAADAFALPSVAEGMSNSLLEAMASALPCVASSIGGNVDLLDDGRSGLLVAPATPAAWSSAILRVLADREFARRIGDRARSKVEADYALPVVVDRYEALYRSMIRGGRAGA